MTNLTIKTRHWRRYYVPTNSRPFFRIEEAPMSEIRRNNVDRNLLISTGGKTQVAIYQGSNKLGEAEARCGRHDNFNRKIGRTVAIGKALKKLGVQV